MPFHTISFYLQIHADQVHRIGPHHQVELSLRNSRILQFADAHAHSVNRVRIPALSENRTSGNAERFDKNPSVNGVLSFIRSFPAGTPVPGISYD